MSLTAKDLSVVVRGLAPVLREYVAAAMAQYAERLASLEQRAAIPGRDGRDGAIGPAGEKGEPGPPGIAGEPGRDGVNGQDADPQVIAQLKAEIVSLRTELQTKAIAAEPVDVPALVVSEVVKAVAALPAPKDGRDGQDGKDGASVDLAAMDATIADHVTKAVAALPKPADGVSVTVQDVAPLITAEVVKAVAAIPAPKDGVGVAGALIDRDGQLVITLSDGSTKALGLVVGKDADVPQLQKAIDEAVARLPVPQDGVNGRDGKDGRDGVTLSADDLKGVSTTDGGRTLVFEFTRGEIVQTFTVKTALTIWQGIYDPARAYEKGDSVTYNGGTWIAKQDAIGQQPGTTAGASSWQLAVKAGREGRAGAPGPKGLDGKDGRPGKDLTNMGFDGSKWGS